MKKYVIVDASNNPIQLISAQGFVPPNSYECPDAARDISEISIVDDINPETNAVMGKKAILDPVKVAAYNAQLAADATAKAWADLRAERDRKLLATDYTQLPDAPLTAQQKTDYATYRQALRDLPANTVDPNNPSWPVEPA